MSEDADIKKRPAFQFYPGDWRKDVELRACSLAARGLWIDLMCVMHECDPYGHLALNGAPMTPAKIAGQIGVTPQQVKKLLDELIENGVARKTDNGTIYSKRMVDDERIRNARAAGGKAGSEHGIKGAEHGAKGGRPAANKGGLETPLPTDLKPPPSSSSSSSTSLSPRDAESTSTTVAPDPTPGARVCLALKAHGIRGNPSHPVLLALVEAGATPQEFADAAPQAKGKADPFAYLLGVVKGQRRDAAEAAKGLHKGAMPASQGKPPTAAELRVFRSSPQIMDPTARARCEAFTNAGHTAPDTTNVIDMEAPNGLAIGLD